MTVDITDALAPTSDQLDAIELVVPRTFTIDSGGRLGTREGKKVAEIRLVDFPRVWRPSKGMLDLLAACWGIDGKAWVGHRVTLYNDPEVMFGRDKVGGIRISHLSHIDGPRTVSIRASGAGRKQPWRVEPLPDTPTQPTAPTPDEIARMTDLDALGLLWKAHRDLRGLIESRVAEIKAQPAPEAISDDEFALLAGQDEGGERG